MKPPNAPLVLEAQDKRILEMLQRDGRMSNADLAEATGMSASACWRRVRQLEAVGAIRGYRAEIDPRVCGLGFQAIVHVQLTRHDPDRLAEFISAVQHRPEVLECFATTGDADYHLRVVSADIDAYNRFLDEFLFRVPGVASARTNVILKELKHHSALPL
ncbi:MAG: Lrp/AsnC family transcriptional regulator [Steroidobacteraceae bacterium]